MLLRYYLILMSLGTALCWLAWVFIIWNTDPAQTGLMGLLFFYFSLWLAIIGTFSVLGFLMKRLIIKNDEVVFRHVKRTFRQGILLASGLMIILLLLQTRLLTWWNATLLVLLFLLIGLLVFNGRKFSNQDYVK